MQDPGVTVHEYGGIEGGGGMHIVCVCLPVMLLCTQARGGLSRHQLFPTIALPLYFLIFLRQGRPEAHQSG